MIVVTAGSGYIDIDSYASSVAYAELLRLLGKDAIATSTASLNASVTPLLRALPVPFTRDYKLAKDDRYVLVDLSDPNYFDAFVDPARVIEIFDHHAGSTEYWEERIGKGCHIEFIGAAATLIFEQWETAGKFPEMSSAIAQLLSAAILDNTLNFGAEMTTDRDRHAYRELAQLASLGSSWPSVYFSDCEQAITSDLTGALHNDTKVLQYAGLPHAVTVGQLVVWDAQPLLTARRPVIAETLSAAGPEWYANIVSLSEGCSYFLCADEPLQRWLAQLLDVRFADGVAKANRMWLRKEIMKAVKEQA